ncbi:MAG: hypothetical protein KC620_13945 [Myxococcales bacterium]|nr:hypothetical protein [Myxococcales bacterium]
MDQITLQPSARGGPVLIHALGGLGKSTLAAAWPDRVYDADQHLYEAVARAFPTLPPRARLRAWRALCQQEPWRQGGEPLARWAEVRRAIHAPVAQTMQAGTWPLVVTSLLCPPWWVSAYYGVERGRYLEHLRLANRAVDNAQSEAMNDRLDGFTPLIRLPPGHFLGQQPEIIALVSGARLV